MMGYSKEYKAYQLFDLGKYHIIIRRNVIFDEKTYGIGFMKSSSSSSYSDPFDIIEDKGSNIPFMGILTSSSTYVRESIGS